MIDDATLMAFVDGELDAGRSREVQRALARSPELTARLAAHRAVRKRVAGAWSSALAEPVPGRLMAIVAGAKTSAPPEVVDLAAVRRQRRQAAARPAPRSVGLLAAACLAVGLVIGFAGSGLGPAPAVVTRGGALVAQDGLARALENQLVADQSPAQPVRIGFTIRAQDGRYCRTFLDRRSRLAGLACRTGARWTVPLAAATGGAEHAGAYRLAGDEMPAPVLAKAQAMAAGPALDAPAESAARELGWR
ncbi:MAG TPA: hypothetical protein VH353_15875 [Caulobacteraceae bacterium]|jgi:hypothetical protein|nr:hypothetical protein [Caulobacteraceae bacterium]